MSGASFYGKNISAAPPNGGAAEALFALNT